MTILADAIVALLSCLKMECGSVTWNRISVPMLRSAMGMKRIRVAI